jgi:transketolase
MREAFAELMVELGLEDNSLVVLVGDISHGILKPFKMNYPDRYYNIGICEPSMVNLAAGLSKVGLNPVVHTIAPFLIERSFEQIKLDFGYQKLGVNLISVGGAFDYSQLGCSHHCYTDVSLVSHIEGSKVFMPGNVHEFKKLFRNSYKDKSINYFRLSEHPHTIDTSKYSIDIGRALITRPGTEITIATCGAQLSNAHAAAEKLSHLGIESEIVYFPTIKPFDSTTLRGSVEKTKRLITVEELSSQDGLFNLAIQSSIGVPGLQVKQLAINGFIRGYGNYSDLCARAGLTSENITIEIQKLMDKN